MHSWLIFFIVFLPASYIYCMLYVFFNNPYVSIHAEITIHPYQNGLSILTDFGQSILVRMYRYFRVSWDKRSHRWSQLTRGHYSYESIEKTMEWRHKNVLIQNKDCNDDVLCPDSSAQFIYRIAAMRKPSKIYCMTCIHVCIVTIPRFVKQCHKNCPFKVNNVVYLKRHSNMTWFFVPIKSTDTSDVKVTNKNTSA